ncbi:MAG: RNA polymerase subunit sigma-70 [Actinomycetota bacterium]|nr:RNA polymerase subunit sigma-70 [Actinomycetota bacterium]
MTAVTVDHELTTAFASHRRELHVHCYRMTGSFSAAEDLTHDTFLRAWAARDSFEGRSSMRTWLYRIATNACLDFLGRHERRAVPVGDVSEVLESDPGLQPYPQALLQERGAGVDPLDELCRRDTTELVFIAALTRLPPRQRAAFIARDVLDRSPTEAAELLGTTTASANSLTQRARSTMRRQLGDLGAPASDLVADEALLRRYVDAHHRGDVATVLELLRDDVRITMPPEPPCLGRPAAEDFFGHLLGPDRPGDWSLVATSMNGRPAAACYLRREGDPAARALSIDVLRIEDGRIAGVHCFLGDDLFPALELPLARRR